KAVAALAATLTLTTLLGCAHLPGSQAEANFVDIGLIAFNDFHGNLEPPHIAVPIRSQQGVERVPAGGAAYLASAIAQLKAR
ncbi:bifunctional metallophosphatase/5'-nucleotidase, partial [Acinetobacter baumannii]